MARLKKRRAAQGLGEGNRELCDYRWPVLSALAHTEGPGSNIMQEKEQETGKTSGGEQTCMWDFCKASALGVDYHWGGMEATCRSPWRPEGHAEITLSTYCQAAVRSWTSTRDRQEEGGGCFQGRVRDAVNTAHMQQGAVFISTSYLFCSPTWKTVSLQQASHRRKVKILKLTS